LLPFPNSTNITVDDPGLHMAAEGKRKEKRRKLVEPFFSFEMARLASLARLKQRITRNHM